MATNNIFYYIFTSILVYGVIFLILPFINKTKLKAKHDFRRSEKDTIPLIGGIVIIFSILIVEFFFFRNNTHYKILIASIPILTIGILDDFLELTWKTKILLQITAISIFLFLFPIANLFFVQIGLNHSLAMVFTFIFIWGITNGFNLIDGLDGAVTSISILIALTLSFMIEPSLISFALIIIAACIGFLIHNKPNAKVYLGDTGSTLLGFFLAILAMNINIKNQSSINLFIPFLLFAFCEIDIITSIYRRLKHKRSIMKGDRDHIHHKLFKIYQNKWMPLNIILLVNICCCIISLVLYFSTLPLLLDLFLIISTSIILSLILFMTINFDYKLSQLTQKYMNYFYEKSKNTTTPSNYTNSPQYIISLDISQYYTELYYRKPEDVESFITQIYNLLNKYNHDFNINWYKNNKHVYVGLGQTNEELIFEKFTQEFQKIIDKNKVRKSSKEVPEGISIYSFKKNSKKIRYLNLKESLTTVVDNTSRQSLSA